MSEVSMRSTHIMKVLFLVVSLTCSILLPGCESERKHYAHGVSRESLKSVTIGGVVFGPTQGPIYHGEEMTAYLTQHDADVLKQKALYFSKEDLGVALRHYLRVSYTHEYCESLDRLYSMYPQDVSVPLLEEVNQQP